jgi:tetratricopeptide (TPR) repeat protein
LYRVYIGKLWRTIARVDAEMRQRPSALRSLENAREVLEPLLTSEPTNTVYLFELAETYHHRGVLTSGANDHRAAVASWNSAIALCERLGQTEAGGRASRLRLANSLRRLGESLIALDQHEEALASFARHRALLDEMVSRNESISAEEYRGAARAAHQQGLMTNESENYEAAAEVFAEAADAFEKAAHGGLKFNQQDTLFRAECHYFIARNKARLNDKTAAIEHYQIAVDLLEDPMKSRTPPLGIKDRYRKSVSALAELKPPD